MRSPARHVLSLESQLYFERIVWLLQLLPTTHGQEAHHLFRSLATDPAVQLVLPYLAAFLSDALSASMRDVPRVELLLRWAARLWPVHMVECQPQR